VIAMSQINLLAIVVAAVSSFSGHHAVQFCMYGLIIGLWR
jgi:hypothetical protein